RIRSNLRGPTFLLLLPCASFLIAASRPDLWSSLALLQAVADLRCRTPWPSSKAPSNFPDQIDDDDERICPPRRGRKQGGRRRLQWAPTKPASAARRMSPPRMDTGQRELQPLPIPMRTRSDTRGDDGDDADARVTHTVMLGITPMSGCSSCATAAHPDCIHTCVVQPHEFFQDDLTK
uniref:Uncharacterized protein n=1 Tax=Triticum urartu TaxID=4572 RepID=A0A8R7PT36_TRIUA